MPAIFGCTSEESEELAHPNSAGPTRKKPAWSPGGCGLDANPFGTGWPQFLFALAGFQKCSVELPTPHGLESGPHKALAREEEKDHCSRSLDQRRLLPELRDGGDCGPESCAWLLNVHGPPIYRYAAGPVESVGSVRLMLQKRWTEVLKVASVEDLQAFVQPRLEQAPEACEAESLEEQVILVLKSMTRSESSRDRWSLNLPQELVAKASMNGLNVSRSFPGSAYWLLPEDWSRLSEIYQVDFVLHNVPGTGWRECPTLR